MNTSRQSRDLVGAIHRVAEHLLHAHEVVARVCPCRSMLRRHRARLAEERIAIGPAWREHDLIFPSALGTPLDPDNVSHWFSRICRRSGLGHWHLHELRHSGASLMLAQGTDLYVVSEVLGHSSVAITKDVYGHLVEGQKRAAAARMSEALLRSNGSRNGSQGPPAPDAHVR